MGHTDEEKQGLINDKKKYNASHVSAQNILIESVFSTGICGFLFERNVAPAEILIFK